MPLVPPWAAHPGGYHPAWPRWGLGGLPPGAAGAPIAAAPAPCSPTLAACSGERALCGAVLQPCGCSCWALLGIFQLFSNPSGSLNASPPSIRPAVKCQPLRGAARLSRSR